MLFAKLLLLYPASGSFAESTQSAQADFVAPAPDFNPGNLTYRSVVFQSGNNESKSISARATNSVHCRLLAHMGQGVRDALLPGQYAYALLYA